MRLRPFFNFGGAKYRLIPFYPRLYYKHLIEPFAGSACYALAYPERWVTLCERDPVVFGVWHYLINASSRDILSLPLSVDDVRGLRVCQEARWLIGFWLNRGRTRPSNVLSAWGRTGKYPNQFWGENIRSRILRQQPYIRHWKLVCGEAQTLPNVEATWFVDPPYQRVSGFYKFAIENYTELARWAKTRKGQVIVCENSEADWLPFVPLRRVKALTKRWSEEVVYVNVRDVVRDSLGI